MSFRYDIFFGFSQIAVRGELPSERRMFDNLLRQVRLADELGFETAWVGGAHLSLAEQHRSGAAAVLPHFEGEVCLNTDIHQLAHVLLSQTRRIGVGSAIHSILVNGGPIAHAEATRSFLTLQALTGYANRRFRLGFAAGRFDFVQEAFGIRPRNAVERAAWPVVKGIVLQEAVEVFTRLVRGDALASADLPLRTLERTRFRSDEDWQRLLQAHGRTTDRIELAPFWSFDRIRLVPTEAPLEQLRLYLGTTDAQTVRTANEVLPTRVFNLSNTSPQVIEATHERMQRDYHPGGGPWQRRYMPRTVLVFVDATPGLSEAEQRARATERARAASAAWVSAMEGTIDDTRVTAGLQNAVYGCPADVAAQLRARYHPDDTLMLWFDFNDHDTGRVEQAMIDFSRHVIPLLEAE